jgi:AcrR family transcriptional regulator
MDQKTDLRIVKTHKALVDGFLQLLGEKRFEDITVNELCERAMVRRATFYKHFADKYEFFAFVVHAKQEQFQTQQNVTPAHPQSLYLDITKNTLDFVKSNKKLVQMVFDSKMLPTLLEILSQQIAIDVTQRLKEEIRDGASLRASPQLTAQFFTGGLVYTIKWWVAQKKVSETELMEELASLLITF